MWHLIGIPCSHAVAATKCRSLDPYIFVRNGISPKYREWHMKTSFIQREIYNNRNIQLPNEFFLYVQGGSRVDPPKIGYEQKTETDIKESDLL